MPPRVFRAAPMTLALLATLVSLAVPAARATSADPAVAAADHTAGRTAGLAAPASPGTQLTLPAGGRVLISPAPGGPVTTAVPGGAGRGSSSLTTLRLGGRQFVIPGAALPYLGRGLDPALFEVSALEHAERDGRIPVTLRYHDELRAVPGITITHAAAGAASGYITASSAARFGAALAGRAASADRLARLLRGGTSVSLAGASPARAGSGGSGHTLTVTGVTAAGGPVTDGLVLVGNLANESVPADGFKSFRHGTARFRVPSGRYWAVALIALGGPHSPIWLDVLPQFTVSADKTVHTSAAVATSKVTVSTPRPALAETTTLAIARTAPGAPANPRSPKVGGLTESTNTSLWINPVSRRPRYGALRVFTSAQLTSPPHTAVPYGYTLNFTDPAGRIPVQHFTARPSALATVTGRYYQDQPSAGDYCTYGGTRYQVDVLGTGCDFIALRLPGRQVQYLSASPAMLWQSTYSEFWTIYAGQTPGGQTSAWRLVHAGQRLTQAWNQYPLHPAASVSFPHDPDVLVPSADRGGNTLNLDITPFSDNQPGDTGTGLTVPFPGQRNNVRGRYAVYQNGVKIAAGDAAAATGGFGDVQVRATLSPHPALIKFVLHASRASRQYKYSAASRDAWTWRSQPRPHATIPPPWICDFASATPDRHCAVQPMMSLRYNIAGLSMNGTSRPGPQTVTITAGHIQLAPSIPVTTATAQISVDGGATWQQARVRPLGAGRFRVTFTAGPKALVSLRVTTADAAGNTLTETIQRAYATS